MKTPPSNRLRLAIAALSICSLPLLPACSWFAGPADEFLGDTLSDLQPARMPDAEAAVPQVSLEEIEESYHRALDVAEDDEVRRKILVRLAGLEMIRSEEKQLAATTNDQFFNDAIAMYKELIELQEGREGRDKLMYQLSKAYALDGRTEESAQVLDQLASEYPNSPYIAEAQFRRAERAFSAGDYAAASDYYGAVASSTGETQFYDNAVYMRGWSLFKRNRYDESLEAFTEVLDRLLGEQRDLQTLPNAQRNLAEDTLRVMSLVFSYLDGPKTIDETYQRMGPRPYSHLLYQRLGDLYLEKNRYRDSADAYNHFVRTEPFSDYAPEFSVRIVKVFDEGDFPEELLAAKEDFVNRYGIRSTYWQQKPEPIRERLRPELHTYLEELAKYEHAQAQDLRNPDAADLSEEQLATMQSESVQRYQKAARWYEEFVDTFPNDEKTPAMVFLLGETFYESGQLAKAVGAYEKVAYEYLDPVNGPEAGYSAILALEQLADRAPPDEREQWREHKTASSISFSDYYPSDERAPKVLATAAQDLLNKGANGQAIAAAERLTQWNPPLEESLLRTAWLIVGQGQFDLEKFSESEYAYRQVLALMPNTPNAPATDGPSREQVVERIAANMYRLAEQDLAADNKAGAVEQLLRVAELAPGTDVSIKAQYDAATYLMDLERWGEAEQAMVNFRQRYPDHELTQTLPPKLVVVYQALEQWQRAADELAIMAANDDDPDVRRQSLYLSAELHERSGNTNDAILAYRQYANTYSEPFDETLEAANKLVELYGQTGDGDKRRFWLNKLIEIDAGAGAQRNDRSRYLAAMAASEFADENYQEFARIPLNLPLKRSLDRKRAALDKTLKAYERILDYGVAQYTTLASYRIGAIYAQLSRDLMESERPANLNELELEQYTVLLEEQAFPFEEQAIEVHEANAKRSWNGVYDEWVKQSFETLAELLPARYRKQEQVADYSDTIH